MSIQPSFVEDGVKFYSPRPTSVTYAKPTEEKPKVEAKATGKAEKKA